MWMSSRTPASTPGAPGRLKKRNEIVFVVPVLCATEGIAGAAVGRPGTPPGAPGKPGVAVRGSPGRPPGAVGRPPGSVVGVVVGATIPAEMDCTMSVAK